MAFTLQEEQRLKRAGLIKFFTDNTAEWRGLAQRSYDFNAKNFPDDATVRRDDVAKMLEPLLEVNSKLTDYLDEKRLTQKYWIRYFCDLILDRTWETISSKGTKGGAN